MGSEDCPSPPPQRCATARPPEELLDRIKSDPPPLPVCMMTAYDNDDYRGRASAMKCDGYVSKPIDFAALKEKINSFIE